MMSSRRQVPSTQSAQSPALSPTTIDAMASSEDVFYSPVFKSSDEAPTVQSPSANKQLTLQQPLPHSPPPPPLPQVNEQTVLSRRRDRFTGALLSLGSATLSGVATSVNAITPHLAGAVDVMVVEQPDGGLKSTPFYGKWTDEAMSSLPLHHCMAFCFRNLAWPSWLSHQ